MRSQLKTLFCIITLCMAINGNPMLVHGETLVEEQVSSADIFLHQPPQIPIPQVAAIPRNAQKSLKINPPVFSNAVQKYPVFVFDDTVYDQSMHRLDAIISLSAKKDYEIKWFAYDKNKTYLGCCAWTNRFFADEISLKHPNAYYFRFEIRAINGFFKIAKQAERVVSIKQACRPENNNSMYFASGTLNSKSGQFSSSSNRIMLNSFLPFKQLKSVKVSKGYSLTWFIYDSKKKFIDNGNNSTKKQKSGNWIGEFFTADMIRAWIGKNEDCLEQYSSGVSPIYDNQGQLYQGKNMVEDIAYYRFAVKKNEVDKTSTINKWSKAKITIQYTNGKSVTIQLPDQYAGFLPNYCYGLINIATGKPVSPSMITLSPNVTRFFSFNNTNYSFRPLLYDSNKQLLSPMAEEYARPFSSLFFFRRYKENIPKYAQLIMHRKKKPTSSAANLTILTNPEAYSVPVLSSQGNSICISSSLYGTFSGGQDGAAYQEFLFRFNGRNEGFVYSLDSKQIISTLHLDTTLSVHANSVCFGTEKYSSEDFFPLLYINVYNNYAKDTEDRMLGTTGVFRIRKSDDQFSLDLVQIIRIGFTNNPNIWADTSSIRPYGNCIIDTDHNKLYEFVMMGTRCTRFFAFELPKLEEGFMNERFGVKEVILKEDDILDQFDTSPSMFLQGAAYHEGKLYSLEGADEGRLFSIDGKAKKSAPSKMMIIDLENNEPFAIIPLQDLSFFSEPEMICFHDGKIFYSSAKELFFFDIRFIH